MNSPENTTAGGKRFLRASWRTCVTVLAGTAIAGAAMAALPPANMTDVQKTSYLKLHMAKKSSWKPIFMAGLPSTHAALRGLHASSISGPGLTVPFWTTSITSPLDGNTYTVSMVGSSPYDVSPHNTNITYVPVALRIHLSGFTLDPTVPGACDSQSPAKRFFNSPLFNKGSTFVSNGQNVSAGVPGGTQLIGAFQRANFWSAVKGTPYNVTLVGTHSTPIVVDWFPSNPNDFVTGIPSDCGPVIPVPLVEINELDSELVAIAASFAKSNQIPMTLVNDTAVYIGNTGNCCVLGYHNAIPVPGGTQVYAVGAYFDTNGAFGPHFADTTVWVHELAELVDDPFVQSIAGAPDGFNNDLTPAWGNTGQVYGCQNNLEAGDPLTPDQAGHFPNYPVTGVGGFVYHYQDLPFHDWFYRTPSTSTGGSGSFVGNLAGGGQGVCF